MSSFPATDSPPLAFWLNSPPQVELGGLEGLAANWPGEVSYNCARPLTELRRRIGWGNSAVTHAVHMLSEPPEDRVRAVLQSNPDAIHIVAGFSGTAGKFLATLCGEGFGDRVLVYTERPGVYGPAIDRFKRSVGLGIKYRILTRKYGSRIAGLLPLGGAGVDVFSAFGWPRAKMFPFMYCPPTFSPSTNSECLDERAQDQPVRFVYVGRFSRFTKGTDTLVKAASKLPRSTQWALDLVGGYGDMSETVSTWAKDHPRVTFQGMWSPSEVASRIGDYDVCIVPSKFDGWNVVVNEAIRAGVGVICSDQAVSHELVLASRAGVVIPARSPAALANSMESVIADPALIRSWRQRAAKYEDRISDESVGGYLASIVDFAVLGVEMDRPTPPW